jgi:hypothetical protein
MRLDVHPIAQDEGAIQLGKMVSTLIPVGLVAVIIAAVFVASTTAPVPSPNTAREEPRELVDRLLREVEALKSENRKLTDTQQRPSGVSTQTGLHYRLALRADRTRGGMCRFHDGRQGPHPGKFSSGPSLRGVE